MLSSSSHIVPNDFLWCSQMLQPHFGQVWGWSPTLGKVGDFESSGTPECLELNRKVRNTSHWGVLGVIAKVLKRRYRKWPCIGHLDICSPSYGRKKGRESNWQFDSRPLKVGNRPLWDMALKRSRRGLQLWFRPRCDRTLQSGVMAVQSFRSQAGTISGLHFGSPKNLCHLDVASMASCREYYMGEGGGFPRVRAVVSLVCPSARGLSQHPRVSWMLN
jgi:hypothetical protein